MIYASVKIAIRSYQRTQTTNNEHARKFDMSIHNYNIKFRVFLSILTIKLFTFLLQHCNKNIEKLRR